MNYATLDKSNRLKRLLVFMADGQKHSTRDIIQATGICAVSAAIAELRANGIPIPPAECAGLTSDGNRIYKYCWPGGDSQLRLAI